jgi:hypothetical protein
VECFVIGLVQIPGKGKHFSLPNRRALGFTDPAIQWEQWALSPGVKRSGCETDHSPPSSSEVKNVGAIPPLSHASSRRGS